MMLFDVFFFCSFFFCFQACGHECRAVYCDPEYYTYVIETVYFEELDLECECGACEEKG